MAAKESIVDQQLLAVGKALEASIDEQLSTLESLKTDDLEEIRRKRLEQMKQAAESKKKWLQSGHGEYRDLQQEKEFFSEVKTSDRVVCHFYRESWPCKVMDKHLSILAPKHIETKFIKLQAEKAPYLAEKLRIFMLPTLALVKEGKVESYVVGFDELGGTDSFPTEALEARLVRDGMIEEDSVSTGFVDHRKPSVRQGDNYDDESD